MYTYQNSSAASDNENYEDADEYETAEYDSGEYYSEDSGDGEYYAEEEPQYYPPPPPGPARGPVKKKKAKGKKGAKAKKVAKAKKAKAKKVAKAKKIKAKKGKPKKGRPPAGRRPPPARAPGPPPPPPPPAYQEYVEEGYEQTYNEGYTESYPQEEYYPMDDQGVVIEDQAMIETVVAEEADTSKKSYQRLTDDPIYSIEEKIDRMLMGKELSLAERFQRKFGEEFVMEDSGPLTSYTPRDFDSEEDGSEEKEKTRKGKGPVAKKKEEKSKKEKKDKKGKKEKKKVEKGEKKASRFGGMKFGGGKDKAKKGLTVAELMGKTSSGDKKKKPTKKVSDIIKKPEPVAEESGMDIDDFTNFKSVVDDLLENLPETDLENFTSGDEFKIYERVGTADDFTDEDNEYIAVVDNLLEKLPEDIVNEFMESENFKLYQKVVEWGSE